MRINETLQARGFVDPAFVNPVTGERIPWDNRHNTLTYLSASVMAAAFGGNADYIPNSIGIIYGSGGAPSDDFSRSQDWEALGAELEGKKANVQIRSFSYSPSITASDEVYEGREAKGNMVTFHMCSDSQTGGAFPYGEASIFNSEQQIFQAVLLNVRDGRSPLILARVSLEDKAASSSGSSYKAKPDNFEVALDWTVKFF